MDIRGNSPDSLGDNMPTLHSTLTGADLHEVKGAAGASAGQVYRADGAGSAGFVDPFTLSNIRLQSTISNFNSGSVTPGAVDTPVVATFDSTQSNSDITMSSTGLITIVTSGLYFVTVNCNIGRSNSTATAILAARMLINGIQFGFTQSSVMTTNTSARPVQFNILRAFSAGDTIQIQIMRDSAGQNDGGLVPQAITSATWGDSPSFFMRVSKILGGS